MEPSAATQCPSLKRKADKNPEQNIKKARITHGTGVENPLWEKNCAETNSMPPTRSEDSESGSESGSCADSDDEESTYDAASNTPPTPFSPKTPPRFPSELKNHICNFPDCGKAFNRPAKLAQHMLSHTKVRPFVCPHKPCTKDFLRQSHLQHHIKSAHSDVRDYICEWEGCGKSFITATRLKRHHAAHEGREKFKCNVRECGQTFRKHGTLQKHMKTVHEGKKAFECQLLRDTGNVCGQGFDTVGKLRAHEGRVHGGRRFWCSVCSSDTAEGQIRINQPSEEGTGGFSTYAELQEHIKINHPPQCETCGLKCNSQRELRNHIEVGHGMLNLDERKTHVCLESGCGRAFTKRGNLNVHIQSAHKAKRYICGDTRLESLNNITGWDGANACGRALSTKGSLESHIRTAHMGMGRPRSRNRRTQRSDPAQEQNTHGMNLLKLTGVGYEEYSGRYIPCLFPKCGFRFGRPYDLQVHLVSRHGQSESEAISSVVSVDDKYDGWTPCDDMPDDPTDGNGYGFSNSPKGNTSNGGRFWIGDNFDERDDRADDDWLEDEREMQKLIDNDGSGYRAPIGTIGMIDPCLQ
ncbi:MAG: hypothetical protein L6R41_000862 [Letrouitia leprolyta]|nr:MAG: hypothetical protein L6R41_000862 [Letrouitia leprolyta]